MSPRWGETCHLLQFSPRSFLLHLEDSNPLSQRGNLEIQIRVVGEVNMKELHEYTPIDSYVALDKN